LFGIIFLWIFFKENTIRWKQNNNVCGRKRVTRSLLAITCYQCSLLFLLSSYLLTNKNKYKKLDPSRRLYQDLLELLLEDFSLPVHLIFFSSNVPIPIVSNFVQWSILIVCQFVCTRTNKFLGTLYHVPIYLFHLHRFTQHLSL
jgi:hypothetical protein